MSLDPVLMRATDQRVRRLHKERHSEYTIEAHRYALYSLLRWLEEQSVHISLTTISLPLLDDYVIYLKSKGLAQSTIYTYIGVVIRWLQYLSDHSLLSTISNEDGDPLTPVRTLALLERHLARRETPAAPRVPDPRQLHGYYHVQLQRFLAQRGMVVPTKAERGPLCTYLNLLRNRALIATLFSTGGRINEILGLTVTAVQPKGRVANVVAVTGKGRKRRSVRLDQDAQRWITDYLQRRHAHFSSASALFISHGPNGAGNQLSDATAWKVVKAAAEALADVRMHEGAEQEELRALRGYHPIVSGTTWLKRCWMKEPTTKTLRRS